VASIAESVEARRRAPKIDYHEEKRSKPVYAKIGTDPRYAERECEKLIAGAACKCERS
jgi:hypothetical protein